MKKPTPLSPSVATDAEESESSRPAARPRERRTGADARRTVDVRDWLGNVRFSGFMVVALGLVVLAALVLVPTFANLVEQQQRIASLERQVELTQDRVDELKAQRERWRDPVYVTTQARERLYYVYPGEVIYLVNNDLDALHQPEDVAPPTAELTETSSEWTVTLLSSLVDAGLSEAVTDSR